MTPSSTNDTLSQILLHYDTGQYHTAYQVGLDSWGPIEQWPGVEGRVIAGRLAHNLGGQRWGRLCHLRLCQQYPEHPDLLFYKYLLMFSYQGPLETWRQMAYQGLPTDLSPNQMAELLSLRSQVYTALRDFSAAERDVEQALALVPDHVWVLVEQHSLLAAMDRREEALRATDRALEVRPYYRPAVQLHAYQLMQLNRDQEAEDLLLRAAKHNQSGDLWSQLAAFYTETRRFDLVSECLDKAEALYLLLDRDKTLRRWLASRRSELAYRRGDYPEAIRLAEQVDSPYHRSIVKSLREAMERPAEETRDVLLDVKFVRQHHLTCAPATLTALSNYWGQQVDHIELAQSICYDGTPAHEERNWAEEHGFAAREFRVTWDNARQLIDRGVPFTLTTIGPQMGHLQPVIGYDSRRGVLLVRDPGERHHVEYRGQELLDHYSTTGPRGMTVVPQSESKRLDGLELEDAKFYDWMHQLHRALHKHDRQAAAECLQQLESLDPNHRLTLHARASLAFYDQDRVRQLRAVEALAERFPKDVNQQLVRLSLLRELGRRADYLQRLETLCEESDSLPIYWRMLATEWLEDQRRLPEAERWVQRILREQQSAEDLRLASRYYWRTNQRDLAVQVLRLAALSERLDESLAADYFSLARANGETEAGLEFLRQRHETLGRQSVGPTYNYVAALEACDQHARADEALNESLAWRPQDGEVMLSAAQFYMGWGRGAEAKQMLAAAESITNRTRWLNTAARFAMIFEDIATQETLSREALQLQPLNMSFVNALCDTIFDRQGSEAAIAFLADYVQRFPEHYELRQMWIGLLRREDLSSRWVEELQRMLELHPDDPWTLRELASVLVDLHRPEEALPYAEQALAIEPYVAASWSMRGLVRAKLGQRDEAASDYAKSLEQSIDWEAGFLGWLEICESREQRLRVFELVQRELKSQVVTGDLLLTLTDHVQPTLDDAATLQLFREMHQARPDLFQSWLALVDVLRRQDKLPEAAELMQQATTRFPLLPRIWSDAAALAEQQEQPQQQIEYLKRALSINPRWPQVIYRLAIAYYDQGQKTAAFDLLHNTLAESPRDVLLRCGLAELYWKDEQSQLAIETMTAVVRQRPGFDYAWECLQAWVNKVEQPELVANAARQFSQERPHEIQSWTLLADVLPRTEETWAERHAALQHALQINPSSTDARRRLAHLYAEQGEFEKALESCRASSNERNSRPLQLCELDLLADYRSLQDAIKRLNAILVDDPDSASLWYRLAEWAEKAGDWDSYHRATAEMVRTAPGNPLSWGYHADSLTRLEREDEALKCLEKAVQLDPTYDYAVASLSERLLKQDKVDELRTVLERLRGRANAGLVRSIDLLLAIREKNDDIAESLFGQLLDDLSDSSTDAHAHKSLTYLMEAEATPLALRLLRARMETGHRTVGRLWAIAHWKQGRNSCVEALHELQKLPTTNPWLGAAEFLLRHSEPHEKDSAGAELISHRASDLRKDPGTFCAAGGFLIDRDFPKWQKFFRSLSSLQARGCRQWLPGWESYEDFTADHWFQLVRIAASMHDWALVRQMSERCFDDPRLTPDQDTELVRFWYTVSLIAADEWPPALEQVAMFRDFEVGSFYESLRDYLRQSAELCLTVVQADDPRTARQAFKQWRESWAKPAKEKKFWRIHDEVEQSLRRLLGIPLPFWFKPYRAYQRWRNG
ncbi:MAG: tetratricopeptide repeat protein [Planctomycetaceae bacterium]|nr:tetratricopeptide repeat protein [Planctomycetaceae bacterium]